MKIGVMLRHHKRQPGGIGTYTTNLLDCLLPMDRGVRYLLMYGGEEQMGDYAHHPNAEEVVLRSPSKLAWDQVAVPLAARRHHLDLVFNPKLSVPFLAPCKSVLVLHGADWFVFRENYPLLDRIYHRVFASLYCRRAEAIVSVSKDATGEIERALDVDPSKIETIYHGVGKSFGVVTDRSKLEGLRDRYDLPDRFLLYLGQIYPMKNVGRIIRAFGKIRGEIPQKLVIVGSPAPKSERDLAAIAECGLEDDVVLVGWVPDEDVPLFYNLADAFVFPSLYEGFGIPILEAMACGCPVITSDRGAPREVAGEAAILVDPTDEDRIAATIVRVLEDRALREDLVSRGLRRVEEFTWEACARRTLRLFRRVMRESGEDGGDPAREGLEA